MRRPANLLLVLVLSVTVLTGCWNFREPNQLAFITGAALDYTKDGQIEVSSQIAIPSIIGGGQESGGGGDKKKSFQVVSAVGKNIMEAGSSIQTQLSRRLFYGHRQVILIGQRMAEHGIDGFIDMFTRNPKSELRSLIYVVKDGEAKDILDPFSSTALVSEQGTLHLKLYYYRNFLSDAFSEGIHPLLPAISLTESKRYTYVGSAVLNKDNDLKLAGFLNAKESLYAFWIADRITSGYTITTFIAKGNGTVSLYLQSVNRQIRVKEINDQVQVEVQLTGKGTIIENNTSLDTTREQDLHIIQDELSQTAKRAVQGTIDKVQKQFKTDIFGFGKKVHEQYPAKWKSLKQEWNQTFPQLPVSVHVELKVTDPGQTTASFHGIF
jgi:spore germination protein KC